MTLGPASSVGRWPGLLTPGCYRLRKPDEAACDPAEAGHSEVETSEDARKSEPDELSEPAPLHERVLVCVRFIGPRKVCLFSRMRSMLDLRLFGVA